MSHRRSTTPLFELLDSAKTTDPAHSHGSHHKSQSSSPTQPSGGQAPTPQAPSPPLEASKTDSASDPAAKGAGSGPQSLSEPKPGTGGIATVRTWPRDTSHAKEVVSTPASQTVQTRGEGVQPFPLSPSGAEIPSTSAESVRSAQVQPAGSRTIETRPMLVEGLGRPTIVGRLLVVPVPFALIGLGVLIVIGAILWTSAWSFGKNEAISQERARAAAMGQAGIIDPTATNLPVSTPSGANPSRQGQQPTDQVGTGQTPPQPDPTQRRTQPAPTPQPAASADPRQPGLNYLRLANLNRDQALAAVERLKQGGLEAFAVSLESDARRVNSTSRFAVYLAQGFPGSQFSSSRRERERLEQAVLRVGQAWTQEGGPTDFRSPFWDKYAP